jgi:hypothetical protein
MPAQAGIQDFCLLGSGLRRSDDRRMNRRFPTVGEQKSADSAALFAKTKT